MLRTGTIVGMVMAACCGIYSFSQTKSEAPPTTEGTTAQAAVPRKARVSAGAMQGMVAHKTMPVYPDEAMKKGIQGNVIFKIVVDEEGKIIASTAVEGDPLLVAASAEALRDFRFRPYLLDGTPVQVHSQLGFHFSVDKKDDAVNGRVECMSSIPDSRTGH